MFTGIVEEIGEIRGIVANEVTIGASTVLEGLTLGCSIGVNGACLTIISIIDDGFRVNVVPETVRLTNLGSLKVGDSVNLERPVLATGRLDGHIVQGHVDGTGTVESVTGDEEALMIKVSVSPQLMRYIVVKGFVAMDGISLTGVDCDAASFLVTVIPHTMNSTTLGSTDVGDSVNLEVDILAKYLERLANLGS